MSRCPAAGLTLAPAHAGRTTPAPQAYGCRRRTTMTACIPFAHDRRQEAAPRPGQERFADKSGQNRTRPARPAGSAAHSGQPHRRPGLRRLSVRRTAGRRPPSRVFQCPGVSGGSGRQKPRTPGPPQAPCCRRSHARLAGALSSSGNRPPHSASYRKESRILGITAAKWSWRGGILPPRGGVPRPATQDPGLRTRGPGPSRTSTGSS